MKKFKWVFLTMIIAALVFGCGGGKGGNHEGGEDFNLSGTVSIKGNGFVVVDDELEADISQLGGTGDVFFQWQSSDNVNGVFTDIEGETEDKFIADIAYENKYIRVVVERDGYTGSKASAAVQVNPGGTTLPTVDDIRLFSSEDSIMKGGGSLYLWGEVDTSDNSVAAGQKVIWSLSGSTNSGTYLDIDEVNRCADLYVAANESANSLTVKIESFIDSTKTASKTITLDEPAGRIVTITGLGGLGNYEYGMVIAAPTIDKMGPDGIAGAGKIVNGSLSVVMFMEVEIPSEPGNYITTGWKAGGDFLVALVFGNSSSNEEAIYAYTANTALPDPWLSLDKKVKFTANENQTIAFNQFKPVPMIEQKLTITGLDSFIGGTINIGIQSEENSAYANDVEITGSSVTLTFVSVKYMEPIGPCIIEADIFDDQGQGGPYVYTDGSTWVELGISSWQDYEDATNDWENEIIPRFNFTGVDQSIDFSKFQQRTF